MTQASQLSISASQQATANLRNADTIEAMGMLATLRGRWLRPAPGLSRAAEPGQ